MFVLLLDGRQLTAAEVEAIFPPRQVNFNRSIIMRKTEGATKAHAAHGYCQHLRKSGKRLANKATRKAGKKIK
jgi:hypothetical protein